MKSKYIIVRDFNIELPIVFNSLISHDAIAAGMNVVSAGFCSRDERGNYRVWGKSVKLGLASRAEDAGLLNTMLETELG